MATETTAFDTYLKAHLRRDLLFRILIWFGIAAFTARYANNQTGVEYLGRVATTVLPIMVRIMWVGMFLSFAAMLLKDLEHVSPSRWGQATSAGKLGGFIRRLASDLTLWGVGAFVTLLSALLMAGVDVYLERVEGGALLGITVAWGVCVFGMCALGVLNALVRRDKPPFTASKGFEKVTSPWEVFALYGVLFALVTFAAHR